MFECHLYLLTFLSPELKQSGPESPRQHSCHRNANPKSNRRNARVFTVKKPRWRDIYYLHGGKICINVVDLAQYDDDWHRNRTHQRGMRDYWEACLCFGKYWCFSSGRNKFELCDRRGNRCAHLCTLAAETSVCLCTTVSSSYTPKQQFDEFEVQFISPESRHSHNVRGFLKWPQIYLSACCRPMLTPPVSLNRISDAFDCCCHAARSHLSHHLLPPRLLCGPLTDLSASPGYSHVFLLTGLQSPHICLCFPHSVAWVLS